MAPLATSSCRLVVVFLVLLLSGGCHAARQLKQATTHTPWHFISTTPGLEILARLIQAANLTSALDKSDLAYTFFLPNNASFAALESEQGLSVDMLLNNSVLPTVLLYHVFPGAALLNLTTNTSLMMANGGTLRIDNDANVGVPLALRDEMGRIAWPATYNGSSSIALGTSQAYIISRVLLPIKPSTIEEALSYQTSMSIIADLLTGAALLEEDLPSSDRVITNLLRSNTTNVTFLVPNNDAFASLCVNLTQLSGDPEYVLKTLLSHILPVSMDFETLAAMNGTVIPTLHHNASFTVEVMYGTVVLFGNGQVPSTLIVNPDLVAGHSFLHVINTVLFPEDPAKPVFTCPPASPVGDYGNTQDSYNYDYPSPSEEPAVDAPQDASD